MRRLLLVVVTVAVVLLAAAGAWVGARSAAPGPRSAPASFALPIGRQRAFADFGSRAAVADVRAATVAALTSEQTAVVRPDHEPALTLWQRIALVMRNETVQRARSIAEGVDVVAGRPPFARSGRFVVERWQGVRVEGGRAKAYVTGHDELQQLDGTPWRDAPYQARLLLVRSTSAAHGWLVRRVVATPLET